MSNTATKTTNFDRQPTDIQSVSKKISEVPSTIENLFKQVSFLRKQGYTIKQIIGLNWLHFKKYGKIAKYKGN